MMWSRHGFSWSPQFATKCLFLAEPANGIGLTPRPSHVYAQRHVPSSRCKVGGTGVARAQTRVAFDFKRSVFFP